MIRGCAAGLLLGAVLACGAPGAAAGAPPASDPRAVAASVAAELKVQQRLPSEESHDVPLGGTEGASRNASAPARSLQPGNLTVVAAWLAAIFLAIFVGLTLADALRGGSRRRELRTLGSAPEAGAESQRAAARASLSTADELAAAGRYTEAIHQLLADAVAMLRRRAGAELSDALTSREIVRALRLPQAEHGALGEIVARVEHTWFARRAAGADDYEAVRTSFRVFTVAGTAAG